MGNMTIAAIRSSDQNSGIESVKRYAKQMLKNQVFTGAFQEKRLVEDLGSYRDIVTICPGEYEDKFIKNLKVVKNKIEKEIIYKTWVGFTEPDAIGAPVGHNLWVVLPREVFGKYFYRVKTVEFLDKEIRLKLDIIRPFQRESTPIRNTGANESVNLSAIFEEKKIYVIENFLYFFKNVLTLKNTEQGVKYLVIFSGAILTASFALCKYLLEWSLDFIRVLSELIKSTTPIIVTITNLIGRTIFGFFQLLYALLKEKPKPAPVYNNYITFDPKNPAFANQNGRFIDPRGRYNKYFNNALPYYPQVTRNGPTITPM